MNNLYLLTVDHFKLSLVRSILASGPACVVSFLINSDAGCASFIHQCC